MIKFVLLVNKAGQPRMVRHFDLDTHLDKGHTQTAEVIRHCLTRSDNQCSFFDQGNLRVAYKRYATLYFIIGATEDENELALLEVIHLIVETFDKYFQKVCELDIMFNIDRAHMILDEVILNGRVVETNKSRILEPLYLLDHATKR